MKKAIAIPALVALLTAGIAVEASAWERNGSFTGPRGTTTFDGSGSCAGQSCNRDAILLGPHGNSATRQGSGSCADGRCSAQRTTAGPRGRGLTRERSISR